MPRVADTVLFQGAPVDGVTLYAYLASRFGTDPTYDNPAAASLPASPDAGPVISGGSTNGGAGEWKMTVPSDGDYWIAAVYNGHVAWQYYSVLEVADLVLVGSTQTITGAKTLTGLLTASGGINLGRNTSAYVNVTTAGISPYDNQLLLGAHPNAGAGGPVYLRPYGVASPNNQFEVNTTGVRTYTAAGAVQNTLDDGSGNLTTAGNITVPATAALIAQKLWAPGGYGTITLAGTGTANQITVTNAATGASPSIAATGSDANIGLTLAPKGSGNITTNGSNIVAGQLQSSGAAAGLVFSDRSGTQAWQWYGNASIARLWNGTNDILTVDVNGALTSLGSVTNGPGAGLLQINNSTTTQYSAGELRFYTANADPISQIWDIFASKDVAGAAGSTSLQFRHRDPSQANASTPIYLDSVGNVILEFGYTVGTGTNGKVGIGKIPTLAILDVAGSVYLTGGLNVNAGVGNSGFLYLGDGTVSKAPGTGFAFNSDILAAGALTAGTALANQFNAYGSTTGNTIGIYPAGTDANIGTVIQSKGSGGIVLAPKNLAGLAVYAVTGAVNSLSITAQASGGTPNIQATGSDPNIGIALQPKGTGGLYTLTGAGAVRNTLDDGVGNSTFAGSLYASGSVSTGSYPVNVGQNLGAGSNSVIQFGSGVFAALAYVGAAGNYFSDTLSGDIALRATTAGQFVRIGSGSGRSAFAATSPALAVNGLVATGTITGQSPMLSSQGGDTNVGLILASKGAGVVSVNIGNLPSALFTAPVGAVNYGVINSASTGNSPTFSAAGSDTNINVQMLPKGSGVVYLGASFNAYADGSGIIGGNLLRSGIGLANQVQMTGNTTGLDVKVTALGSDANVPLTLASKGTSTLNVQAGGAVQFQNALSSYAQTFVVNPGTGVIVNHLETTPTPTGQYPTLSAAGTDANVGMQFSTKGTGLIYFNPGGTTGFAINNQANAVNYAYAIGAVAGGSPTLGVAGTDANIALVLAAKGTQSVALTNGGGIALYAATSGTAVNQLQVIGTPTGSPPIIQSVGSDANIGLNIQGKGTGSVILYNGNGTGLAVGAAASSVNYLYASGSAATTGPYIQALGSDANISISLISKGTYPVSLSAGGQTSAQFWQGYWTGYDAAGVARSSHRSGVGAPTMAATVGDFYYRQDGGGAGATHLYVCTVATGTWIGIA